MDPITREAGMTSFCCGSMARDEVEKDLTQVSTVAVAKTVWTPQLLKQISISRCCVVVCRSFRWKTAPLNGKSFDSQQHRLNGRICESVNRLVLSGAIVLVSNWGETKPQSKRRERRKKKHENTQCFQATASLVVNVSL